MGLLATRDVYENNKEQFPELSQATCELVRMVNALRDNHMMPSKVVVLFQTHWQKPGAYVLYYDKLQKISIRCYAFLQQSIK